MATCLYSSILSYILVWFFGFFVDNAFRLSQGYVFLLLSSCTLTIIRHSCSHDSFCVRDYINKATRSAFEMPQINPNSALCLIACLFAGGIFQELYINSARRKLYVAHNRAANKAILDRHLFNQVSRKTSPSQNCPTM